MNNQIQINKYSLSTDAPASYDGIKERVIISAAERGRVNGIT